MNWVRHGKSTARLAVLHGSSTTWFQTSRHCRTKVEFSSINWLRHSSSTTFETSLSFLSICMAYLQSSPVLYAFLFSFSSRMVLLHLNTREKKHYRISFYRHHWTVIRLRLVRLTAIIAKAQIMPTPTIVWWYDVLFANLHSLKWLLK